jgi:hypothetical protein
MRTKHRINESGLKRIIRPLVERYLFEAKKRLSPETITSMNLYKKFRDYEDEHGYLGPDYRRLHDEWWDSMDAVPKREKNQIFKNMDRELGKVGPEWDDDVKYERYKILQNKDNGEEDLDDEYDEFDDGVEAEDNFDNLDTLSPRDVEGDGDSDMDDLEANDAAWEHDPDQSDSEPNVDDSSFYNKNEGDKLLKQFGIDDEYEKLMKQQKDDLGESIIRRAVRKSLNEAIRRRR